MSNHTHIVSGEVFWKLESENLSVQFARCECGQSMSRSTTPIGAVPNWNEWKSDD